MKTKEEIIEKLQENYYVKPATIDDAVQIADLLNACSQHLIGLDEWDPGELTADWGDPSFKLEDHSLMVFSDEKLIAYVEFWAISPPYVRHSYLARVHPDYRGRGIGRLLNDWAEAKDRGFMQLADAELKVILTCIINSQDKCAGLLMDVFGSEIVRSTWVMEADLSREIEQEKLPEGYELRIVNQEEIPEIYALKVDTFRDHWGSIDIPFDEGLKQFTAHFVNDPFYRPDLWFVVEYCGEKIGLVIGNAASSISPTYGWVNLLGVKRSHRKKGIGRILLQYCNRVIKIAGGTKVGLSVDSSNLTGATRLYEDAGFKVIEVYNRYEKVLRDGKDIRTQSLSN